LRYAAKACDEFQALIPRDIGIISGDMSVSSPSIGSQRKFKKPQVKDPNAPKRPNTAYILFSNEIRAETKAANPNANQKEIVTLIGQKWKALSREDKKVYEDRYFADKERYDEELRAYRATHGQVESPPETSSNEDDPNASGAASSSKQVHTPNPFVFKQAQTGTQSHFVSQLHMSQVDSTALGSQVLPISVPPSETETAMLDSIIGTFPTTNSTTFTQNVSTDTTATTSPSKKRRSPGLEGNESQKQDEGGPTVKRTRASAKKNQTTTEPGQDSSVFTPPDDPEALTEQDEVATGTKRQRTKRGSANGSVTPAPGPKTTASATRRKRGDLKEIDNHNNTS